MRNRGSRWIYTKPRSFGNKLEDTAVNAGAVVTARQEARGAGCAREPAKPVALNAMHLLDAPRWGAGGRRRLSVTRLLLRSAARFNSK